MWTVDPSADVGRSAAIFATVELPSARGGLIVSPPPRWYLVYGTLNLTCLLFVFRVLSRASTTSRGKNDTDHASCTWSELVVWLNRSRVQLLMSAVGGHLITAPALDSVRHASASLCQRTVSVSLQSRLKKLEWAQAGVACSPQCVASGRPSYCSNGGRVAGSEGNFPPKCLQRLAQLNTPAEFTCPIAWSEQE